ncbi:DUF1289 domain-containing protein [Antarctobacter heliothermus]|uniref:Predicted Fe-S protein YdhL, DUF1289 family n=1 Tax=Antarctobacter heliothermus TaxID=74033 RepID=A0A239ING1_9RHOB|nr:Predicted Fe-S protein YdhL, DUF1289 family [Antarctobacter heliothermus]
MSRIDRLPPASPCVARCVIDETSQLCTGCARSLDEIAGWGSASDDFRSAVWAELPARASRLGLKTRRLSWQGDTLLAETARRLSDEGARLIAGIWGASGELVRLPDAPCEVQIGEDALTLTLPDAALRLDSARYLTAFEIDRPDAPALIALAVPVGRAFRDRPAALTALGQDEAALLSRNAGGMRFDLGLGRRAARFTVRCDDALAATLARATGTNWPDHLSRTGLPLRDASPVRVIETPCLRLEIDAAIPMPDGTSPSGPHTHLLPDHIAQGLDTPPTVPMPAGYVATALILPAS